MRIRKTTIQWIIVITLIVIIFSSGFGAAYYYATKGYKSKYEALLQEKNEFIESNKRYTYITNKSIKAGEKILLDNVELQEVMASQEQDSFIDNSCLGATAIVDIVTGISVTKNMISSFTKEQSEFREVQYSQFVVSPNISVKDYCDVRIAYPNGETYIVLAKKQLIEIEENMQDCCLWMTPEEINRMQSCIVDAYIYEGSRIFLTKYIEPNIQEASIANYTPSIQVIELIENDPNIIQIASDYLDNKIRMELENRLWGEMQPEIIREWSEDEIEKAEEPQEDMEKNISDDRYFFDEE